MNILEQAGPALRILRRRAGMTQKEVAEAAEISKNLLSNWETGTTAPSLNSLDKTLKVLGADLLDLHNTVRLLQGMPAEHPPAEGLGVGILPANLEDRQAQLLAQAPEVVRWVIELLRTIQAPIPAPREEER